MFGENYAFVFTGKEKNSFNHLDPMGYKYLSSLKETGYKLLLRKRKLLLVSSFTLIHVFICKFKLFLLWYIHVYYIFWLLFEMCLCNVLNCWINSQEETFMEIYMLSKGQGDKQETKIIYIYVCIHELHIYNSSMDNNEF